MRHDFIINHPHQKHKVTCNGELEHVGDAFKSDVNWVIYRCKKCGKKVVTVEGRRHWWNYDYDDPPAKKRYVVRVWTVQIERVVEAESEDEALDASNVRFMVADFDPEEVKVEVLPLTES